MAVAAWIFKVRSGIDGLEFHGQQGLNAQVVQQGEGLSTLILGTPPMAAIFFLGSPVNFNTYIGMVGHFAAGVAEKPGGAGAG